MQSGRKINHRGFALNFSYNILRSSRRTLSVSVSSSGEVTVHAPFDASLIKIEKFVEEKRAWIISHVKNAKENNFIVPSLADGTDVYVAGRTYRIKIDEVPYAKSVGEVLFLPQTDAKHAFGCFVKRAFLPYVSKKTKEKAILFDFDFKNVKVGYAGHRWGSCSSTKTIRYTAALALVPELACDGVVIHELCHTVIMNHGKDFYDLLFSCMPQYEESSRLLKRYGAFCSFFEN